VKLRRPLATLTVSGAGLLACTALVGVGNVPTPESGPDGGSSGGASTSGSSSGSASSGSASSGGSGGSSTSGGSGGSSGGSGGSVSSGAGSGSSGSSGGASSSSGNDSGGCPAGHFCANQSAAFCDDFDESTNVLQAWCGAGWTTTLLTPPASTASIVSSASPGAPSPPGSLAVAAAAVAGGVSQAGLSYAFTPPSALSFDLKFALMLPAQCSISSPPNHTWGFAGVHLGPNYFIDFVIVPNGNVLLSQINSGTPSPTPTGLNITPATWTNVELSVTFSSPTSGSATVKVGTASAPVTLSPAVAISTTSWQLDLGVSTPAGVTTSGCSAYFDNVTFAP
jgi:hypothetical protein